MFEEVKKKIGEIVEIADKCPEKYQVKCFEVLLNTFVQGHAPVSNVVPMASTKTEEADSKHEFFDQYGISEEQWQNVFHYDAGEWKIIVRDLKESTNSKNQIRLALLLGVKAFLETGIPLITREVLVPQCKEHGIYDHNFPTHMKRSIKLLSPRGKDEWTLTYPGRSKAAEVIKELAS